MGDRMFSKELIGKEVVTISGRTIGILEDIVIDTDDGSIKYFLMAASGNVVEGQHKVDGDGRLVVETDRIRVNEGKLIIN